LLKEKKGFHVTNEHMGRKQRKKRKEKGKDGPLDRRKFPKKSALHPWLKGKRDLTCSDSPIGKEKKRK